MTSVINDQKPVHIQLVILSLIAVVIGVDLAVDWSEGASVGHLLAELSVVILASFGSLQLIRRLGQARREADELRREVATTQAAAEAWRTKARDHLRGLACAIDEQFAAWELTRAEREVALLLLKGLSMKEVGEVRDVSPRTVRQQAHAVYQKGGLAGRADLSAFFLEDLLLPTDPSEAPLD